jgi:hypothetical protein
MSLEFELNPSEKISMLLDGELEKAELGNVFLDVAQSEELQDEFVEQLGIRSMMKPTLMTPPSNLHTAIISNIGLSAVGGGFFYYLKSLASNRFFIGSVAMGLGFLGSYLLFNNQDSKQFAEKSKIEQSELSAVKNSLSLAQSTINNDKNLLITKSKETDLLNNELNRLNKQNSLLANKVSKQNEVIEELKNEINSNNKNTIMASNSSKEQNELTKSTTDKLKVDENESSQIINSSNKETISIVKPLENNLQNNLIDLKENTSKFQNENIISPNQNSTFQNSTEPTRFILNFRGFSAQSMESEYLEPVTTPALNNVAMGIMYEFSNNFKAGFEFGQENFVQSFSGISDRNTIQIVQNRLTFWGGLNMVYTMDKISSLANLQPYASLFLGGTDYGYITRQSLGLTLDVNPMISFYSGFEFTTLASSYNNLWQSSQKYGMTYGLMMKF